jgi:hypothetical protein
MQKFQQNGLLDSVNLTLPSFRSKNKIQPVLCHLLPLINGIAAVNLNKGAQLVDFYNTGNSKEIYELYMKMVKKTRLLNIG